MSRIRQILFNTDMVRTILREVSPKTMTRRTIKGYIPGDAIFGYTAFTPEGHISCRGTFADGYGEKFFKLPCQKGDILYVRETWKHYEKAAGYGEAFHIEQRFAYKADENRSEVQKSSEWYEGKWHPSIHMPKEAARIWLKVTDVRVEWLHDMTLDDFLTEGVIIRPEAFNDPDNAYLQARDVFVKIWDSTVKKEQIYLYGWDGNPRVWTIEFERCGKPEEL